MNGVRRLAVFDLDGTLLRMRREVESAAYVEAFDRCFGITGVNDDWSSYHAGSDEEIARIILAGHFGRSARPDEVSAVRETYLRLLGDIVPEEVPGAAALLAALAARGDTGFALSTGNWEDITRLRLGKAGMWRYFRCGGYGGDGSGKVEILGKCLAAARRCWPELRGRDIVSVGDSRSDAAGARQYGVHFIGLGPKLVKAPEMDGYPWFSTYTAAVAFLAEMDRLWGRDIT